MSIQTAISPFVELFHSGFDTIGLLLKQRDELTPPHRFFDDPDRVDGSRDLREFISIGESTVKWLIGSGLEHNHKVLEVGCGIGRMALPLTKHLSPEASYEGIDITAEKIRYCRKTISENFSNFRFQQANLYNKYYNPYGKYKASEYQFPYSNEAFHFVFLISVFTHMLPQDMEHYLAEISRVLNKGGKCVITFYLADVEQGNQLYNYSNVCHVFNKEEPEHGVVYNEDFIKSLYGKYNLSIESTGYGTWHRKAASRDSYQDFIIATKN